MITLKQLGEFLCKKNSSKHPICSVCPDEYTRYRCPATIQLELYEEEIMMLKVKLNKYERMITPDVVKRCPELLEFLL